MATTEPNTVLSVNQRTVLAAICNAIFHSTDEQELLKFVPDDASAEVRKHAIYLAKSNFTDLPGSLDAIANQFVMSLSPANVDSLGLALTLLATRAGTFLLAGHLTPFAELTLEQREQIMLTWANSRIPLLNQIYRGFAAIALYVCYSTYDDCALATGFPALGDPDRYTTQKERNRAHFDYKFEQINVPYQYIDTEVLIVGSGAGGGVVSSQLASKGWKTLVVEMGSYYKPEDITGKPRDGFERMYLGGGLMATEDGSMNILAGSTFGGGTVVNWAASLRPQHFLREQWAKDYGLDYFLSQKFADSVDFVCNKMGVSNKHLKHNVPNQQMIDASVKLGYPVVDIPQNTNGHTHECGLCGFGCIYSEKQSGPVNWLKTAAEHGSKFMVNTQVERLLFAASADSPAPTQQTLKDFFPSATKRRCVGALVKDKQGNYAIIRSSRATVVSSGSLCSPAVLLRSGLKNPRIGRNLRLHPTTYVSGFFEEQVKPWEGAIMTAVSSVRENWDGSHHGVKIEVIQSFPGGRAASFQPWYSSTKHKQAMVQFGKTSTLIAIARDRGSGRIVLDKNGDGRMEYTPSSYDCQSLLNGIIAMAEMQLVAGAVRVVTTQIGVPDYDAVPGHTGLTDPRWKAWIAQVKKVGVRPGACGIGSAHQMGSNQMGTKPSNSVVDPRARVWGTEGLWVADASVFPTASGVNPMITNMSLSHSISQFIDEDLRQQRIAAVEAHL